MKLYVEKISSPNKTVTISYAGGEPKEYNVKDIKGKAIPISDTCEDYSTVTVAGQEAQVTDLDYEMSESTFESDNLNEKLNKIKADLEKKLQSMPEKK